jgi:outer membrane protein TolC
MNKIVLLVFLLISSIFTGQENNLQEFTFNEYLGFVKKYHPLVKQANLKLNEAQAILMQARGAFDPKLEADFSEKQFKDQNYYSVFNGSFKIPTWYGIEIKAAFDNSEGVFLNPDMTLPNAGLTSLGVTVPIGQGLFINERMADIRNAKLQQQLNQAERDLEAIEVLHRASIAYFEWKKNYNEVKLYEEYLKNANIRFEGVLKLIEEGDKPAIDSTEAGITVDLRRLNLENSTLKLQKSRLELSNYLWLENNVPIELDETLFPEIELQKTIKTTLETNNLLNFDINNHPKINALSTKINMLKTEQQLSANMLLPKIDLSYNYLSETSTFNNYRFQDYKVGVNFAFPLFLRKERAKLKLAKLKVQDTEFSLAYERVNLKNKIEAQQFEIASLERQIVINDNLVKNYNTMLSGEEQLFNLGESSLFLINTRENNLVISQINALKLENELYNATVDLYKTIANPNL